MVSGSRGKVVDILLNSYSVYYDVEHIGSGDLVARMDFHHRGEQYILSRRVNMWSEEDHEYVYLYSGEVLDEKALEDAVSFSLADGTSRIRPGKDHKRSTVTLVMVYDRLDGDASKKIKRHSYHRSFRMMLDGWMEHRVVAAEMDTGKVISGRRARDAEQVVRRAVGSVNR